MAHVVSAWSTCTAPPACDVCVMYAGWVCCGWCLVVGGRQRVLVHSSVWCAPGGDSGDTPPGCQGEGWALATPIIFGEHFRSLR